MRFLFLFATSFLGFGQLATAQLLPPEPAPLGSLATAHYSADDTLRAIHRLFWLRSRGAVGPLVTGTGMLVDAAVTAAVWREKMPENLRIDNNQQVLAGGLMLGYGLFQLHRFGADRYESIVAAYQAGEPLPRYVCRRLKPKFFRYYPLAGR